MSTGLIILFSFLIIWFSLTFYELINIHRFNLKFFDYGFRVWKKELSPGILKWDNLDGIYKKNEGKYVFIPELKIGYFVTRFYFVRRYGIVRVTNIFPITIFGIFSAVDGKLNIEYKISYRLISIIVSIILLWFYLPIWTKSFSALWASLVGVLLTCLILFIWYRFKRIKMILLANEIENLLKFRK
jgi:hypothetical protein